MDRGGDNGIQTDGQKERQWNLDTQMNRGRDSGTLTQMDRGTDSGTLTHRWAEGETVEPRQTDKQKGRKREREVERLRHHAGARDRELV